jgi:hypothetical protein
MRDKTGRHGHSPNFVAFTGLMDGLEGFSKSWGRPVREIVHDEQSEFRRMLHDWHEIWSRPSLKDSEPIRYPGEERHSLSRAAGSKFRMTTEDLSAGLQVVDVVLWLFKRAINGTDTGPNCEALMNQVFKKALQCDFSFEGARAHMKEKFGEDLSPQLSAEKQEAAAKKMSEIEAQRQKQMREYAAQKAASRKAIL